MITIVIVGGVKSGKSTIAHYIKRKLRGHGIRVHVDDTVMGMVDTPEHIVEVEMDKKLESIAENQKGVILIKTIQHNSRG